MDIDFYWVFFFLALVGCVAVGFGISSLIRDSPITGRQDTKRASRQDGQHDIA